ncbi:zf-HC2 domain-containing protein [Streptomyces sp. NPDC057654]|uniref:zf-HC2 domain-containing protein n=1 Tax=Streptomyces sp. NPDC057654 TaxID=3346196 RepID=UPI0036B47FA0
MALEHLGTQALRAYRGGLLRGAALLRADAHLAGCADCRAVLSRYADPARSAATWARLTAERDAPEPGAVERVLLTLRVPGHAARLITATPALRRSWLAGAVLTLLLTLAVAHLGQAASATLPFWVVAPALPVGGVALSFGPRVDPMYEMTVVAPFHGVQLLLLRTVTVVATALVPAVVIAVALPESAGRTLGWLLPSLALTSLTLALSARIDPVVAACVVGGAWALCLSLLFEPVRGLLLSAGGQAGAAIVLCGAALSIALTRASYDRGAPFPGN